MKAIHLSVPARWTLGRRLATAFAVVVALLLAGTATLVLTLREIHSNAVLTAEDELPSLTAVQDVLLMVGEIQRVVLAHVLAPDAATKQKCEQSAATYRDSIAGRLKEVEERLSSAEDRSLFARVQSCRDEYVGLRARLFELSRAGRTQEALAFNKNELEPAFERYWQALKELRQHSERALLAAAGRTQSASLHGLWITLAGSILATTVAAFVGWHTRRKLQRLLRPVVGGLQEGSVQLASAAAQLTSTSQSLAQGASEQAASLEETSASLEELTAMTQRNAANAQQARQLAAQTRAAVEAGQSEMIQLTRAMDDIQTASAEISKIIKTIDEIAFQTNLLALNAAVEAARAGEAGMGFAVVADEVRALAQRAAAAARETAEKIENSVAKSQAGAGISQRVAQHLEEILTKARQVDELVAEIAAASQEQSQGIGQINSAVSQMDKVTQANAAAAEQSAAAAQELTAQAASLRQAVHALAQLVGETGGTSAETASGHDPFRHPSRSRRAEKAPAQSAGFTTPARANRPEPVTVGHEV